MKGAFDISTLTETEAQKLHNEHGCIWTPGLYLYTEFESVIFENWAELDTFIRQLKEAGKKAFGPAPPKNTVKKL